MQHLIRQTVCESSRSGRYRSTDRSLFDLVLRMLPLLHGNAPGLEVLVGMDGYLRGGRLPMARWSASRHRWSSASSRILASVQVRWPALMKSAAPKAASHWLGYKRLSRGSSTELIATPSLNARRAAHRRCQANATPSATKATQPSTMPSTIFRTSVMDAPKGHVSPDIVAPSTAQTGSLRCIRDRRHAAVVTQTKDAARRRPYVQGRPVYRTE